MAKRRGRRIGIALIALVVCIVAAAGYSLSAVKNLPPPDETTMGTPTLDQLLAQKDVVDVKSVVDKHVTGKAVILLSYDTRNKLETCGCSPFQLGGVAPRVSIIKAARAKMPALVLDAGGIGDGADSFNLLKMETLIAAMKEGGYDGVNIGISEMQLPPDKLVSMFKTGPQLYSANVFAKGAAKDEATPPASPAKKANLATLASPEDGYAPIAAPGFTIELMGHEFGVVFMQFTQLLVKPEINQDYLIGYPEAAFNEVLAAAPDIKEWILVAEGYDPPIEEFANKHPEIAIVLSGNKHVPEEANAPKELETGAYWFNTFLLGKYIGIINLDTPVLSRRLTFAGVNLPILSTYEQDAAVTQLIKVDLHSKLKDVFQQQSFEFKAANIIPPEDCRSCHAKQYAEFKSGPHINALKTLEDKGQEYNLDCVSCHVVYDYTNDKMYTLQCISCHQEKTPLHGFRRQAGQAEPEKPVAQPTYEFCVRCHTPEQSTRFKADFKEYLEKVRHWD